MKKQIKMMIIIAGVGLLKIAGISLAVGETPVAAIANETPTEVATPQATSTTTCANYSIVTPLETAARDVKIEMKNKIVITETKGMFCEKKTNGKIVELSNEISKKIKGLSLEEINNKMNSASCEERFFATWQYRTKTETPQRMVLKDNDDWNEIIRKLIVDLYWTSNDGTGELVLAKAFVEVSLILLEHKTVEYFEKNELNLYEDGNLKDELMMNVLNDIAKDRKDLIYRIKLLVDPVKFQNDPRTQETAKYFIEKIDKYQKGK